MAAMTVDPSAERLTVESIPVVDLRFLTQSELSALSRCSLHAVDLSRCDDVVIPKIDRSVFNESAGSRKQTYSRFRLARRKPDFSSKPLPLAPGPSPDDPERLDNSKIIALFKQLFNADSQGAQAVPVDESLSISVEEIPGKKRGRKPKTIEEGEIRALVVYDDRDEKDRDTVKKNGVIVDLAELAKLDDPFASEIQRRTEGMVKDDELLGFLTGLDGQWGSRRKRRKIVDANEFGHVLPNGWKVLLGMKKKQGQCWLFCRRYISPSGRYFMTCKEVSSYLMSLSACMDVKQPPFGHCSDTPQLENQLLSVNAETTFTKDPMECPVSPVAFEPDDHGKQNPVEADGHGGIPQEVGLLKCHKCSTSFSEKNHLLHHLLSCHKRKRRKSGMPMEDDELMKEGHYECQFCNKRFTERVCFFGHVGIHVKNYMKSLEESPGVHPTRNGDFSISTGGISPPATVVNQESVEINAIPISAAPDIAACTEFNSNSTCGKFLAESDPKDPSHIGDHESNVASVDGDQINIAHDSDLTAVEKSTDKGDAVPALMDDCTDADDLKLDTWSGHENASSSDGKNATCQMPIEDTIIVEAADDSSGSKVQVQITDSLISEVENSAGLLNVTSGFCNEVDDGHVEQVTSKSELFGEDINKSVNENNERPSNDNVCEPRYHTELKPSFVGGEAMFGCGKSEIGQEVNVTIEAHQEIITARSSVVPQGKEETALPESVSGRHLEQSSPAHAQDNLQRSVAGLDANTVQLSTSGRVESGTSEFRKNEVSFDVDSFNLNGRDTQSLFVLPGDVVPANANSMSAFRALDPRKNDVCVNIPFPSPIVVPREEHPYGTESSSPCRTSSRKEPKSAVVNSADFFNPKCSLDANPVANKEVVNFSTSHLYSPLGTREAPKNSNIFGICNAVMEESKRKSDSESVLSSLSVGGHAHGFTGQIHDTRINMNDNSSVSCATHLPDLGGNMGGMSTGVLPSFPPQTIPTSPSPFSLWNDQSFGVEHNQSRVCDSSREEGQQTHVSDNSSLSLASFQQTCNVGYNLNEAYISSVDNFSRLNPLETHRETDLMIGFGNLNPRSNQAVSEVLWRSNEGNAMPSGLGDSSCSQGQLSGAFQPFDFLSDKGENDIFSVNEKFENMANYGGLRSTAVEPMEFSFLTTQDSNPQLGGPKVMSYGNTGIEQGFESSVWLGKDNSMPNMNARSSFTTVCVWCGSQFQQDSIDADAQAGSIGYLCPSCKARISGQF